VLDTVIKRHAEEAKATVEIVKETDYSEKLFRGIVRKIDLKEYKRKPTPCCLRVSTQVFGVGCRVPITQRYADGDRRDASTNQIIDPVDRRSIPLRGSTSGPNASPQAARLVAQHLQLDAGSCKVRISRT
jgi:hypothetical protein